MTHISHDVSISPPCLIEQPRIIASPSHNLQYAYNTRVQGVVGVGGVCLGGVHVFFGSYGCASRVWMSLEFHDWRLNNETIFEICKGNICK